MSLEEKPTTTIVSRSESERIGEERKRYVARGVATTPLVVARADGARIWDVDGREYVDFAGEHTSQDSQGYLNGAVESGERAASEILDDLKHA